VYITCPELLFMKVTWLAIDCLSIALIIMPARHTAKLRSFYNIVLSLIMNVWICHSSSNTHSNTQHDTHNYFTTIFRVYLDCWRFPTISDKSAWC